LLYVNDIGSSLPNINIRLKFHADDTHSIHGIERQLNVLLKVLKDVYQDLVIGSL